MKHSGRSRAWLGVFRERKGVFKILKGLPWGPQWFGLSASTVGGIGSIPWSGNWHPASHAAWSKTTTKKILRIQNPWTILMYDYASTQTTPHFVLWFYALDGFFPLFLNICVLCAKSLQSFPTLCNPIDHCPRCSSHPWDSPGKKTGSFSRGSSQPRDPKALAGRFSTTSATCEAFLKVIQVNRMITRNLKEYKRKWYTKQTKFIWATLVEELEQECYQVGLW